MAHSTVLVTGGAGYIGSHVVLQLRERGEKVVVLDSLVSGFRQAVLDTPLVVGDVGDRELASIGLEKPDDALVFAIVTVPAEAGTVTANLMGPVIVNRANRKGMQAVLTDPRWQVKHDIVAELAAKKG